ncbi:MAG: aspartate aminotransferase family protein [Chloroflexi bacterium]|nr:aspartate aminotransferase family protein [Chloroflexota bacterium]
MATILEQYIAQHPGSAQRYTEAVQTFPSGVTHDNRYAQPFPLYMTHGAGPRKWDVDGNEYIDYICGHGALLLGHSHPEIADAVAQQMYRGTHLGASTDEELRWARAIKALVPSIEKIRFHSSGTEATLMAMRLARAYTGKNKIIKLQDHFHGWHDYAMAGSDRPAPGVPAESWASMLVVPSGDLSAVEDALSRDQDVAGLILEPTGAHYGQLPFDTPNYLEGLRQLTSQHGAVLIFDEVVTGFRASAGGAQTRYGVTPDLTCFGKVIGGGMPVGAFGGREDIMSMWDPSDGGATVQHAGTFNGNPMTAAAGIATLETLTPDKYVYLEKLGNLLRSELRALFAELEVPMGVTGIASLFALQFTSEEVVDYRTYATNDMNMMKTMFIGLLNEGFLLSNRCAGNVSTVHTEDDVSAFVSAVKSVLRRAGYG